MATEARRQADSTTGCDARANAHDGLPSRVSTIASIGEIAPQRATPKSLFVAPERADPSNASAPATEVTARICRACEAGLIEADRCANCGCPASWALAQEEAGLAPPETGGTDYDRRAQTMARFSVAVALLGVGVWVVLPAAVFGRTATLIASACMALLAVSLLVIVLRRSRR
jgi:hypothetical protein